MEVRRNHRRVVALSNRTAHPLRVWIEPWAEELFLDPDQTWLVVCDSPRPEPIPVEVHDDSIMIYGVSQSTISVFCGKDLVWECYPPLP